MPFADYTELQAAVTGWLHRKDLGERVPDFIALAETSINRIVHVNAMENEVALTLPVGERSIPLPIGYSTPLAVWLAAPQPREELSAMVAEALPVTNSPGRPRFWAIDGQSLAFECPADVATPVTLRYRGGFRLSDDVPTNALLTKYPDIYLYGTLLQAAPYIRDNDSIGLWQAMYRQAVKEINSTESRARAAAPLRTELAGLLGRCSDHFMNG